MHRDLLLSHRRETCLSDDFLKLVPSFESVSATLKLILELPTRVLWSLKLHPESTISSLFMHIMPEAVINISIYVITVKEFIITYYIKVIKELFGLTKSCMRCNTVKVIITKDEHLVSRSKRHVSINLRHSANS